MDANFAEACELYQLPPHKWDVAPQDAVISLGVSFGTLPFEGRVSVMRGTYSRDAETRVLEGVHQLYREYEAMLRPNETRFEALLSELMQGYRYAALDARIDALYADLFGQDVVVDVGIDGPSAARLAAAKVGFLTDYISEVQGHESRLEF